MAGLSNKEREEAQNDFLFDRVKVVVATNALVWVLINPMYALLFIIICLEI